MDLVRPLVLAGIPCTAVAPPGEAVHFSRFTSRTLRVEEWTQGEELVDRLLELARPFGVPPTLFYQTDGGLQTVSRHRDRLGTGFRFIVPPASLVEDLVDKARFQQLAARLDLPVPASQHVRPAVDTPEALPLSFPLIVKPLNRAWPTWRAVEEHAKAVRIDDAAALSRLWPQLADADLDVLLQDLIPGDESRIESYHAYVDETGTVAAEFTGRKIRTYPTQYGHSTAVQTTCADDVAELGREILRRLDYQGVAKLDFKRSPDDRLRLLEVNPRFSLWHYIGALAGVNIPAVVHADLVGTPRPACGPARPGVTYCRPRADRSAARTAGLPFRRWLGWALRADVRSGIHWDDPLPFVCGKVGKRIRARSLRP